MEKLVIKKIREVRFATAAACRYGIPETQLKKQI
jgi:hypothetical protein